MKLKITAIKNFPRSISVSFATMLLFFFAMNMVKIQASSYEAIMKEVEKDFEQAEDKFSVISRPMNSEYIGNNSEVNFQSLYSIPHDDAVDSIMHRTHALGLAVCAGDVDRVEKFLEAVKNPNDPLLLVGGYRQLYNMFHIAVDPKWPMRFNDVNTAYRVKIIDLLADSGFDPNFIPCRTDMKKLYHLDVIGFYCNPPLTGYSTHGSYIQKSQEELEILRARLLLRGADPTLEGSSFFLRLTDWPIKSAFNQVFEENLTNLNPVECVRIELTKMKDAKLQTISKELSQVVLESPPNTDALLKISNELQQVVRMKF